MKKVLFACGIAFSAIAFAASSNSGTVTTASVSVNQDTVPKKKDTTTVPLPDTTKTPPAILFNR